MSRPDKTSSPEAEPLGPQSERLGGRPEDVEPENDKTASRSDETNVSKGSKSPRPLGGGAAEKSSEP